MAEYVIGDIQGCYDPLMRLLDLIEFDERQDRLLFVGDLVNRGPASLAVIEFIRNLEIKPVITLGNHDLHLLARIFTSGGWRGEDDTLQAILNRDDVLEIGHWLRKQSILYHHPNSDSLICHAGIAPCWDMATAEMAAKELEDCLSSDAFEIYLNSMYGNEPVGWDASLTGMNRLRIITNYFTRMRFCDAAGRPLLDYKGTLNQAPPGHYAWFMVPGRINIKNPIIFGHWAALQGKCPVQGIYAIDTGCLWGGALTALRLDDFKRFSYPNPVNY